MCIPFHSPDDLKETSEINSKYSKECGTFTNCHTWCVKHASPDLLFFHIYI